MAPAPSIRNSPQAGLSPQLQLLTTQAPSDVVLNIEDYGCRSDDPSFDNGPPLTRLLARVGEDLAGTLKAPAKDFYFHTPIYTARHGGDLEGSGGVMYQMADSFYQNHTSIGGVTRFIWVGKAGEPMLVYRSHGLRLAKIVFQGQPLKKWNDVGPRAGAGIRIESHSNPNSSHLHAEYLAIHACEIGVDVVNTPTQNHADHLFWDHLLVCGCPTAYRVNAPQSVNHTFTYLSIQAPQSQVVFDFVGDNGGAGGVLRANVFMGSGTLLRVDRPTHHHGYYKIDAHIDSAARNWRPLEVLGGPTYPCRVRITGNVGGRATIADPPVVCESKAADIEIDMQGLQWSTKPRKLP